MMRALYAVLLGLSLAACEPQGAEHAHLAQKLATLPAVLRMDTARLPLTLEIADDDHERERGLMFRDALPPGTGMLFVWPEAAPRTFWMKNTPIPLDMVFMRDGQVVGVIPWAKPFDESPLGVADPADMVLEVPGGWTQTHGVGTGWTLELTPRQL